MRKEKYELIKKYIEELKTIKFEINDKIDKRFVTTESYLCTLNNKRIIPREKILKSGVSGSAVIVAPYIKETNEFLVVIEPRVFTKLTVGVSFPAGYIEEGEDAIEAGLRELKEETGYTAKKMIHLDSFYQDEGISEAYNHSFLALDCEKKYDQGLEENEIIKYITLTYEELLELENEGMICGANTKLTLAKIKNYFEKEK